jgi:hypothetical protein
MNSLDFEKINSYANDNLVLYYNALIKSLKELNLDNMNPYLFKTYNICTACELIEGLLNAFLSSSEEKLFGDFLEGLAIFIAEMTCSGHKSSAPGIDLELFNKNIHYIISIKSGPNWGNSSQQDKLEQDFKNAVTRVKQLRRETNIQPVLGICYGKTKTSFLRGYMKVVGQNFWYLISENKNLYTDIIEPIGYKAKEQNESFFIEKSKVTNRFTKQFIDTFCDESGAINWEQLVEFNSGNFDLDKHQP